MAEFCLVTDPKLNEAKFWISQLQWRISPEPDGPGWFDTLSFSLAPRFSAGSRVWTFQVETGILACLELLQRRV